MQISFAKVQHLNVRIRTRWQDTTKPTESQNVNDLITSNTTLTVVDADNSKTIGPAEDHSSLKSQITVDDKLNQVIISQLYYIQYKHNQLNLYIKILVILKIQIMVKQL
ncbi:hypothetical protein ACVNP0_02130 [Staphylococcus aureus]